MKKKTILYDTDRFPNTELGNAKNISVSVGENGHINIRIYIRLEGEDDRSMTYVASADEVRGIAAALSGTHEGFLNLANRATRWAK